MTQKKGSQKPRRSNITLSTPKKNIGYRAAPSLLRGVLGQALKKFGLDKDIARYQFILYWKEIVGEGLAQYTKPDCIRNGSLVVRVQNNALAQELSFQKQVILSRLKKYLDDGETVNDVRFYVAGTIDQNRSY